MEDLKQIQEFFLNENVFVEAFKLEKALKGMGYDVKVKYLDDFGKDIFEIYFNNPADADDDSIFYDVKKLGYDNVRVFANPQESLDEAEKLTYNDFVRMVKDDMMAGSSPDERPSEELVGKRAKAYYNDYLQGASVDDLFEATKDEETEFHTKLDKLVHDTFGKRKGELEESSSSEERRIAKRAIRSIAKYRGVSEEEARNDLIRAAKELGDLKEEEGYSKFLKDDPEHPGGKTKGLTPDVMNKILMKIVQDIDETKQLGEGVIEEELCEKGKAYRKKRMAAGEKSSAYLNGRAVKVCKGQMKG